MSDLVLAYPGARASTRVRVASGSLDAPGRVHALADRRAAGRPGHGFARRAALGRARGAVAPARGHLALVTLARARRGAQQARRGARAAVAGLRRGRTRARRRRGRARRRRGRRPGRLRRRDLAARRAVDRRPHHACSRRSTAASAARPAIDLAAGQEPGRARSTSPPACSWTPTRWRRCPRATCAPGSPRWSRWASRSTRPLFAWCERHADALAAGEPAALAGAVARAIRVKARVVHGRRARARGRRAHGAQLRPHARARDRGRARLPRAAARRGGGDRHARGGRAQRARGGTRARRTRPARGDARPPRAAGRACRRRRSRSCSPRWRTDKKRSRRRGPLGVDAPNRTC